MRENNSYHFFGALVWMMDDFYKTIVEGIPNMVAVFFFLIVLIELISVSLYYNFEITSLPNEYWLLHPVDNIWDIVKHSLLFWSIMILMYLLDNCIKRANNE